MAILNISQNGKAAKGRTLKASPIVDLTAMVDLAFLLITFFMLTTSLTKSHALDVVKPVPLQKGFDPADWPASRTMTIVLGENNTVIYYLGEAKASTMGKSNLANIGKHIALNKDLIFKTHEIEKEQNMLVIIKPTDKANFKDFVDILDEMKINGVVTYAIDDKYILPAEIQFMKTNGI